jgi:hypothetical protein
MPRGRPVPKLVLTCEEPETLHRWARQPKTAQALALRGGQQEPGGRLLKRFEISRGPTEPITCRGENTNLVSPWRGGNLPQMSKEINDLR